jgi:hypothetical protein
MVLEEKRNKYTFIPLKYYFCNMQNEDNMYEFGLSEFFVLAIVIIVFCLGIYTLIKFMKSKDF